MRVVQLARGREHRVGVVEEPDVRLLSGEVTIYALAQEALNRGHYLRVVVEGRMSSDRIAYDPIYAGSSEWRLLVPVHHPGDAARCLVSGTGLTHLASAANRDAMHTAGAAQTDSMKMYLSGESGGRPAPGEIGVAPEWFYKGSGDILRAHLEPLDVPAYAEDGGEEPEIAAVYVIGPDGTPWRAGMTIGNEFSDHAFEKRNYLYLAGSKLRTCSIGPELILDPDFEAVSGRVSVERTGQTIWECATRSGERGMCHSLENLEHHHFKFESHRRPGDLHVHFLGACAFSFGAGIALENGDVMQIEWEGFGRALRNPVRIHRSPMKPVQVRSL